MGKGNGTTRSSSSGSPRGLQVNSMINAAGSISLAFPGRMVSEDRSAAIVNSIDFNASRLGETLENQELEVGTPVTVKEILDAGDNNYVAWVREDRGDRVLLEELNTTLALGSTRVLSKRDLVRIVRR